ncbi:MAG: glycosyl transferase family protein [Herbinix sp.]|jgi:hypothetical protein|nr:glycosyl transferase family protein [Herbinix sp.]
MNENLIAFIICSNNELKLNECKYYLSRLQIPEGYETDIIVVTGADSMTQGYQAAMLSTDARYKVYLHNDTFIINEYFIRDILSVFQSEEIGMLGVIGCKSMPFDAYACTSWDVGKVLHNIADKCLLKYQSNDKGVTEVDAIDGLLMVTQYDINWRTDIFKNWDFYDISQCYEFHRKRLKVVVPFQEDYWCYHDNDYSKMGEYDYNRNIFIKEYQDIRSFKLERPTTEGEISKLQFQMKDLFGMLIRQGKVEDVFFLINQDTMLQELGCMRDYSLAAMIHKSEEDNQTKLKLDLNIMEEHELVNQLCKLKFLLKRMEFHCEGNEDFIEALINSYSIYAIYYSIIYYVRYRRVVLSYIYQYCKKTQKIEEACLVHRMIEVTPDNIPI